MHQPDTPRPAHHHSLVLEDEIKAVGHVATATAGGGSFEFVAATETLTQKSFNKSLTEHIKVS